MQKLYFLITCLFPLFLNAQNDVIRSETGNTKLKTEDFCVKSVEFDNEHQTFIIDLEYKGNFYNYPILQIEVDNEIVANEEEIFEFYGQTNGVMTHIISSSLKSEPEEFVVIVMDGTEFVPIRLNYPCKE